MSRLKVHRPHVPLEAVRSLVDIEYRMVAAGCDLEELASELESASRELPECKKAARQVLRLRALLAKVLEALDEPISAAVLILENERTPGEEEAPPF